MKSPKQTPEEAVREAAEALLRTYGVQPSDNTRENLRRELEKEKEKFVTLECLRSKQRGRDISR